MAYEGRDGFVVDLASLEVGGLSLISTLSSPQGFFLGTLSFPGQTHTAAG